jgi:hypothetical protein
LGWTRGSGVLRCDGDRPAPQKSILNRYNATMPAAQAFPGGLAAATLGTM